MIADILFEWNQLTVTLAVWSAVVSLAVTADFGPDVLRERKARALLAEAVEKMAIAKAAEAPAYDPDETFKLGVYNIQKVEPVRRRHAKI